MSYNAIKWSYASKSVLKSGVGPSDLAVLRALCWVYCDAKGTRWTVNCFPSVAKLAKMTGLKIATVNNAKRRLREAGLIEWDRAANLPGKQKRTNSYRLKCLSLEKKLKANEEFYNRHPEVDPLDDDTMPIMTPGMDYYRPDPATLRQYFDGPDATERAEWLADALAFVLDTPLHRKTLLSKLRQVANLDGYRNALAKVRLNSRFGRRITNRIGYLVAALKHA